MNIWDYLTQRKSLLLGGAMGDWRAAQTDRAGVWCELAILNVAKALLPGLSMEALQAGGESGLVPHN